MLSKSLFDNGETIYRVLAENEDSVFVIDCIKRTMPFWVTKDALSGCNKIDESILYDKSGLKPVKEDELSQQAIAVAHKKYSTIAPAVAVVADKNKRNESARVIGCNISLLFSSRSQSVLEIISDISSPPMPAMTTSVMSPFSTLSSPSERIAVILSERLRSFMWATAESSGPCAISQA